MATEQSLSIANPNPKKVDLIQKGGLVLASLGVLILLLAWAHVDYKSIGISSGVLLTISIVSIMLGTTIYSVRLYMTVPEGIKNNHVWQSAFTNRGVWGWVAGIILTGFYILLYWHPHLLGAATKSNPQNTGIIGLFDPLAQWMQGKNASQWFVYGTLYTIAILALGIKFMYKYRHNRYQLIRTIVVICSQLFLAYMIPQILEALNYGSEKLADGSYVYYGLDPKNIWPLNYSFVHHASLSGMTTPAEQPIGMFYLVWGIILFAVATPIITYYVGKRWYCSWVCGCGGLAETAGDPYRHLSDKSLEAWQIERVVINGVIVFVALMSGLLIFTYFAGWDFKIPIPVYLIVTLVAALGIYLIYNQRKNSPFLKSTKTIIVIALVVIGVTIYFIYKPGLLGWIGLSAAKFKSWYGFFIGAAFSGVIGVGFYPLLGNRVWCRFGCPMAGYMGLIQRFKSKFRITTNGGQCISCGNCSTYCEQGIDVRAYAQRGENIIRSSCVGCGICSAVCPRGVLKLENGPEEGRIVEMPPITGTTAQK